MSSNGALVNDAVEEQHYRNGVDHAPGYSNGANGANSTNGQHNTTKPHQSMVSQVIDPQFFKVANPGPLGLISFALTTFVVGLYQCGAGLPDSNPFGNVGPDQVAFGLAVFFGGVAQFIAGIMEFRVGNTFGTTVHCSYGAFWLAFSMLLIPYLGIKDAYQGDERAFSFALGIFFILWCFLTLIFFIGALRTNIAILTVFGFLTLAFFFLSLAQFLQTESPGNARRLNKTGGAFAVIDAAAAFYAGASGIMTEDTTWVTLPLGEISYTRRNTRANAKNKSQA